MNPTQHLGVERDPLSGDPIQPWCFPPPLPFLCPTSVPQLEPRPHLTCLAGRRQQDPVQ